MFYCFFFRVSPEEVQIHFVGRFIRRYSGDVQKRAIKHAPGCLLYFLARNYVTHRKDHRNACKRKSTLTLAKCLPVLFSYFYYLLLEGESANNKWNRISKQGRNWCNLVETSEEIFCSVSPVKIQIEYISLLRAISSIKFRSQISISRYYNEEVIHRHLTL